MSLPLELALPQLEAAAQAASTGLAQVVSRRGAGLLKPGNAEPSTSLDFSFLEQSETGNRLARAKVTVRCTIIAQARVPMGDQGGWTRATDLANWIAHRARDILYSVAAIRDAIFASVSTVSWILERGDSEREAHILRGVMIDCELSERLDGGVRDGFVITMESEITPLTPSDARVVLSTSAKLVEFTVSGTVVSSPLEVMYANAMAGDEVDIVDQDDIVVESLSLTILPVGIVTTSALGPGTYTARLDTATSSPSTITAPP